MNVALHFRNDLSSIIKNGPFQTTWIRKYAIVIGTAVCDDYRHVKMVALAPNVEPAAPSCVISYLDFIVEEWKYRSSLWTVLQDFYVNVLFTKPCTWEKHLVLYTHS